MIIGNIDDYGYLKASVDELAFSTSIPRRQNSGSPQGHSDVSIPPGVGARDLRECLMLQLERAGQQNTLEYRIVNEFMERWASGAFRKSPAALGSRVDEVQEAVERSRRLEPRPGRAFLPDNDQYILPEVFVQQSGDDFIVTTNNEHIPHLRISNTYKDLMSQGENSAEVRELHSRKNSRREISHQEPAPAPADDPEHRQGNRETAARVHGKRRRAFSSR